MEETPLEATPSFSAPTKRKINKRFIYLIIAIIAIIVLFFGFKALTGGSNNNPTTNIDSITTIPTDFPTNTPEPTTKESLSPTDSPTPTKKAASDSVDSVTGLDRADLNVTIQNGSGEAGVAGTGSDLLKNLGYDVSGTDNADNFDYTGVTIKVKSTFKKYLNLLKNDLKGDYTITASSSDLDDSFSSDALVIIGK